MHGSGGRNQHRIARDVALERATGAHQIERIRAGEHRGASSFQPHDFREHLFTLSPVEHERLVVSGVARRWKELDGHVLIGREPGDLGYLVGIVAREIAPDRDLCRRTLAHSLQAFHEAVEQAGRTTNLVVGLSDSFEGHQQTVQMRSDLARSLGQGIGCGAHDSLHADAARMGEPIIQRGYQQRLPSPHRVDAHASSSCAAKEFTDHFGRLRIIAAWLVHPKIAELAAAFASSGRLVEQDERLAKGNRSCSTDGVW